MTGRPPSPRELIALIHDLDRDGHGSDVVEYVEISRWNGPDGAGGSTDERATEIVRGLLREKLGTFPLEEIGAATLAAIDAEVAA